LKYAHPTVKEEEPTTFIVSPFDDNGDNNNNNEEDDDNNSVSSAQSFSASASIYNPIMNNSKVRVVKYSEVRNSNSSQI
jgi:hypothetical protein